MTYSSGTHRHCCPADTRSVDTSTQLASWIDLFGKCSPNGSIGILLSSSLCMLSRLVYNACQLEVAGIYKTRALISDLRVCSSDNDLELAQLAARFLGVRPAQSESRLSLRHIHQVNRCIGNCRQRGVYFMATQTHLGGSLRHHCSELILVAVISRPTLRQNLQGLTDEIEHVNSDFE